MLGALTFLLIGSLLQGALCGDWSVTVPQTVEAVKGCCVTIPCSFDLPDRFVQYLNSQCEAIWKKTSNNQIVLTQAMAGNAIKKNCTSTFNIAINSDHYYFRLQCPEQAIYGFSETPVNLVVTDHPPAPNLTPSPLEVKEGSSVNLTCSAPAPCQTHPPTLTWTPSLGDVQEQLLENDKTKVKMSVLTFNASHLHDGENISCTVVYTKQDGSRAASVSSLTAAVSFPPRILPSSNCTTTAGQINCSCETVGNPSPTVHWYLDGQPVSQSDKSVNSSDRDDKGLRSFITVTRPQEKGCYTLMCHSFNSLGSASQQFRLEGQASAERHDQMLLPLFITTTAILLALVCALLCVIRTLKNRQKPNSHLTGEISQVATSQHLIREANEASNTTEEDIYVNSERLRQPHTADLPTVSEPNGTTVPSSRSNSAKGVGKSSEKNGEESDVVYSTVSWKSKNKKGADSANMNPFGFSYLEEEKSTMGGVRRNFMSNAVEMGNLYDEVGPRNVRKESECEYAQVTFKGKSKSKK
ncbi:Schwann cell myelin protein-like [Acanthochromis polyacanthus]|uniref:Schwann cell myelin protein-like n=1 Tax=Acanthochromis polyacanthus TaxID=80966 RepID=UPI0022340190|nr:Schwann cell myelin protein-like [Acanthochromis polyacanthus]